MKYAVIETYMDWDLGDTVQTVIACDLSKGDADALTAENPSERETVTMDWLTD